MRLVMLAGFARTKMADGFGSNASLLLVKRGMSGGRVGALGHGIMHMLLAPIGEIRWSAAHE